jgi:tRNA G18 (ribose-2'-O)-methylase SpoU
MPADDTLRSRANPLYKRLRALKERAGEGDLCLLEGPRLVLEALAAGLAVVEAVASPRAEASPAGEVDRGGRAWMVYSAARARWTTRMPSSFDSTGNQDSNTT